MGECSIIIRERVEVTVSDFEAALYLTTLTNSSLEMSFNTRFSILPIILQRVRFLNLSLYRNVGFYRALSFPEDDPVDALPLSERHDPSAIISTTPEADLWRRFCAGVALMPHLVRVRVFFDCDARAWRDMDEQAILSPLVEAAKALPAVKVSVHLPQVRQGTEGDGWMLPLKIRLIYQRNADQIAHLRYWTS